MNAILNSVEVKLEVGVELGNTCKTEVNDEAKANGTKEHLQL